MSRRKRRRPDPAPGRTATPPLPPGPAADSPRFNPGWIGAALFAVAALSRILPFWREVVSGGRVMISDPDACYHLRRAEWIARNFPDLGLFDPYVNHPSGARVIWPPLYDLLLGGLTRLFPERSGAPGASLPVALLPALLFGLTVLALFAFARPLWPRSRLGPAFAAGVVCCLWAIAPYTRIGNLDHHAAEYLMVALFLLTFSAGIERSAAGRGALAAAWLPGLILGAALLVQLTLVALIPFAPASLLLLRDRVRPVAGFAAAVTAIAGLAILPFALLYQASGAPIRHDQFGLFQPLLLLAATLLTWGVRAALAPEGPARRIVSLALLTAPAVPVLYYLADALRGGGDYLFRRTGWIAHIGESRSPVAGGWSGLLDALLTASPLLLLLPVALFRLSRLAWRGDVRRGVLFFALCGFTALGGMQARFLPHLCLLLGIAALAALEPFLDAPVRGVPRRLPAAAALILLSLLPTRDLWRQADESKLEFDRARGVLEALARETPPTRSLLSREGRPEYGVMAEWSYGHFIQFHGRRPAVADNFGDTLNDLQSVSRFFLARGEAEAEQVLRRAEARYVLVGDLPATLSGLNLDDDGMARYMKRADRVSGGRGRVEFTDEILETVMYRLAWRFGGGLNRPSGGYIPPLVHFRLVSESTAKDPLSGGALLMPHVKLFERVAGARLRLTGLRSGQAGSLLLWIESSGGSRFPLLLQLQADAAGAAETDIPYPSRAAAGRSRIAQAEFAFPGLTLDLPEIPEEAVATGRVIPITAHPGRAIPGR